MKAQAMGMAPGPQPLPQCRPYRGAVLGVGLSLQPLLPFYMRNTRSGSTGRSAGVRSNVHYLRCAGVGRVVD